MPDRRWATKKWWNRLHSSEEWWKIKLCGMMRWNLCEYLRWAVEAAGWTEKWYSVYVCMCVG